jgi:hypothetical protein
VHVLAQLRVCQSVPEGTPIIQGTPCSRNHHLEHHAGQVT